jgi:hypothetical protein
MLTCTHVQIPTIEIIEIVSIYFSKFSKQHFLNNFLLFVGKEFKGVSTISLQEHWCSWRRQI